MYKTNIVLSAEDCIRVMKEKNWKTFDNYFFHKFVYSFFPKEKQAQFSYNIEEDKDNYYVEIYSSIIPDVLTWINAETNKINMNSIKENDKCYFYLKVNAIKRKNGKFCNYVKNEDLQEFLNKKDTGIKFLDIKNFHNYKEKMNTKTGAPNICVTRCEGIIEIIDKVKFEQTLLNGIGREKTYGYGMLKVV